MTVILAVYSYLITSTNNSSSGKGELLSLLNERLMNKETLPTLKYIRFYLESDQLPMTKVRSREKAVDLLLVLFLNMKIKR